MIRFAKPVVILAWTAAAAVSGCGVVHEREAAGPETLVVYADGSMEFRDRPIAERDVVIYEDGLGGEKAAIRIRAEPLHPDFFRDTIVVERR